jgi:hypothetical protein
MVLRTPVLVIRSGSPLTIIKKNIDVNLRTLPIKHGLGATIIAPECTSEVAIRLL